MWMEWTDSNIASLVPRPRPAFRRLKYGKAVEGLEYFIVSDVEGREKVERT